MSALSCSNWTFSWMTICFSVTSTRAGAAGGAGGGGGGVPTTAMGTAPWNTVGPQPTSSAAVVANTQRAPRAFGRS